MFTSQPSAAPKIKVIPQFSNYAATIDGKIWSYLSKRFLKPTIGSHGYYDISLWENKKRYRRLVHRLILETFIGDCPKGMEACHNNGIKTDNKIENLRWDTRSSNRRDAINHGTFYTPFAYKHVKGEQHGRAKLTEVDVRMIIYMYRTKLFTQQKIADIYNISRRTIGFIINKKVWKHLWT